MEESVVGLDDTGNLLVGCMRFEVWDRYSKGGEPLLWEVVEGFSGGGVGIELEATDMTESIPSN